MTIQLLVSVRDAAEAIAAVEAGADIIDVKEPANGPLGFAGWERTLQIRNAVNGRAPVSAALGESVEWLKANDSPDCGVSEQVRSGNALSYVKLGLAGTCRALQTAAALADGGRPREPPADLTWIDQWAAARSRCERIFGRSPLPSWVAVAYADFDRAHSPDVMAVLDAAVQSSCRVFLIDTFVKDGQTTAHWLTQDELTQIRTATRDAGIKLALAGQLTHQHLPLVREISADIFAVRGAVCSGADRSQSIDGQLVANLVDELNS